MIFRVLLSTVSTCLQLSFRNCAATEIKLLSIVGSWHRHVDTTPNDPVDRGMKL